MDADVNDATITTTDEFTIDNQIPEITAFTVLRPMLGGFKALTELGSTSVKLEPGIQIRYFR